jgi:rsbT co-antagonist protein RsbR
MTTQNAAVGLLLQADPEGFVSSWLAEAGSGIGSTAQSTSEARKLMAALHQASRGDADPARFDDANWAPLREILAELSRSTAAKGISAGDTSRFVLAIKRPLFDAATRDHADDPKAMSASIWWASTLADRMAQYTLTTYQQSREEIIMRQQQDLLELSTPVIKLWDGVLAVPMIGTLDSGRTQLVMEALLQRIVDTGSEIAIIDITGVPTVDTLVAQHLLKTVTAIRLMGAECIISGVRPQIAQTIVHLGIDLQGITTKSTLADALAIALKRTGFTVSRSKAV